MPKKPVGNMFTQRINQQLLLPSGTLRKVDRRKKTVQEFYSNPNGTLFLGDSLDWLKTLKPGSVDLIFADPPYNLGKADWDVFQSCDDYIAWCVEWISLCSRALKDTGSLYVCGFSEILANIIRPASHLFAHCKWLVWCYKNKANLSTNWGRSHESILHYRKSKQTTFNVDDVRIPYGNHTLKYPEHPQATSSQYGNGKRRKGAWTPNPNGAKPRDVFEIPVTSNGMKEKTPHPTQKPEELLRKIVLASSNEGELVVDPFVGAGTAAVCAEQLGRHWFGCDTIAEYLDWAVMRLESMPHRSVKEWIDLDRNTALRRESIR